MIDRLTSTDDDNPTVSVTEEPETFDSAQALLVRGFPADVLADELRRRGWKVGAASLSRSSEVRTRRWPATLASIASAARMTAAPVYAETSSNGNRTLDG